MARSDVVSWRIALLFGDLIRVVRALRVFSGFFNNQP
jgi:hypothetical protein